MPLGPGTHPAGAPRSCIRAAAPARTSIAVKARLPGNPLILVGGTNGKGSTCAMLERILLAAGYRTGLLHLAAPAALQRAGADQRRCGRR
jgi:UDP-N-acetylmuramoylalanine-D-glutamate ligase